MNKQIKAVAPYIFALAAAFFIFQLFLFAKSFNAEYNLYLRYLSRMQTSDPFWTTFWFGSEFVGEVGLALRFLGACFFVAFSWLLVRRKEFAFSFLRRAVLLEGAYYLFNLPFILSLYLRPNTSLGNVEAATSYALQLALVTPVFFLLSFKLKKAVLDRHQLLKWSAIAIVAFTFALWIKHFLLNLYALPINLQDPVLLLGLLNSALTMLIACFILIFAFMPIIKRKQLGFSFVAVGVAFLLIGLYFVMYIVVSLFNQRYLDYLLLTEIWAVAFAILGIGCILRRHSS
jgi:hypothetical protein